MDLADDVRAGILSGFRLVQLDEMMVTKRTLAKADWTPKLQNASIDWQQMGTGALAVIAAVSRERGVEQAMIFPKSVNVPKFKIFLESVRAANPFDNIMLVMDNLSVHRNREVLERMEELSFRWAYTPRYSPAFNGIEEMWSISKAYIKKERLNEI